MNTESKEQGIKEYTKANPGCYHSALSYLSSLTNISMYKILVFNSINQLYSTAKSGKKKLKFKSYNITVIDQQGERHPYCTNQRFDHPTRDIKAVSFEVETTRSLEEFHVPIKPEGSYKDSLGGGWHSDVHMYSINGQYFADMECAH